MHSRVVESVRKLPHAPGCYVFKDGRGSVLYVGKAGDLRKRVAAYLKEGGDGRLQMPFLEAEAADVEFVATGTEQEALLLENTLIKKFKPKYNIRLKDDKAFLMLRLDRREEWPWFRFVRRRRNDGATYFGPFASARSIRKTLGLLHKVAPLRDCTDSVFENRSRPCLKYQIGRCPAPCTGYIDPVAYSALVDRAVAILRGETAELERELTAKMIAAAERLEFELAQAIKDNLSALQRITEREQVTSSAGVIDRDVVGLHASDGMVHFAVLAYRDMGLEAQRTQHFRTQLPIAELLSSFVSQMYRGDRYVPRQILLPAPPVDHEALAAWLAERRGGAVEVLVPQRGDKRRAVELANKNAELAGSSWMRGGERNESDLDDVKRLLGLSTRPARIHCLDISTMQGRDTVASRVALLDGQPFPAEYRRFKIRGAAGGDDFSSMEQAVRRSLRLCLEREGEELPDLLLIDGGKGQLSAAQNAARDAGLGEELAIVAIAKDKEGKGERVFRPGRSMPVALVPGSPAFSVLTRARDEAHRFAVGYHRKVREKIGSELDEIDGLGPRRRRDLLRYFGSLAAIRAASLDELVRVPGLPRSVAEAVFRTLGGGAPEA
ncbi:MAG: excinuclease ABC subunit UvrC [Planctomycetes bacterium]|nr:excinuclease ABC subunit UvrC [Planctomycetota bacterium]MCB9918664.1 excinuclease ABC subunit UvrC [Planctomycetota bacterium]